MLSQDLAIIFDRDLLKLKEEISAYQDESVLWKTEGRVTNSAGNLCLHLIGNLNHFIGAMLGGTGYVRERDLEFSLKNISRVELLQRVDEVRSVVAIGLSKVKAEDLDQIFGGKKFMDKEMSTSYFLCHLLTHLAYHLGQINYHRRLLDPRSG